MNIAELFVTLGVKGQGIATLKDIGKTIANLPLDAAAAIAGMAGISLELHKMAEEAIKTSVAFQMFGNQTGLSWMELQKWQLVAEQANVSVETVTSSVSQLERNIQEIKLGRGNIAPFQMLGISPNQNAFQVIEQLRSKIRGINPAMATNIISQMGLAPEMMNVLRLTDRQFTDFANRIHGLTERQQQDFLKTKLVLTQVGEAFRYSMFGILAHFAEAADKAFQFKQVMIDLGQVAVGLAIYFFPVTAAVAALILVLDDLAVYFTGGKSLTGAGIKGFDKFMAELTGNKNFSVIKELANLINYLATGIERLQAATTNAGASFRKFIDNLPESISSFDSQLQDETQKPIGVIASDALNLVRSLRSGQSQTSRSTTVNVNVNGADSGLDAPGWSNVAHMIKNAVESAHLQLNN